MTKIERVVPLFYFWASVRPYISLHLPIAASFFVCFDYRQQKKSQINKSSATPRFVQSIHHKQKALKLTNNRSTCPTHQLKLQNEDSYQGRRGCPLQCHPQRRNLWWCSWSLNRQLFPFAHLQTTKANTLYRAEQQSTEQPNASV